MQLCVINNRKFNHFMENNYITVAYKLYVTDEKEDIREDLVEECNEEHPFLFISNMGCVLPAFEKETIPLKAGEKFDFVIPCSEAYGEFNPELMFDVDKKIFEVDGVFDSEHIYEGNIIPLQGADGDRFNGTVIEIKDDAVTIDLNHPRAGQDLHFVGTVVANRPATTDEVAGMAEMMSGGGCDCGCCGHDCDCDDDCNCGDEHHCGCGHCH